MTYTVMMVGSVIQGVLVISLVVAGIYGSPIGPTNRDGQNELGDGGAAKSRRSLAIGEIIFAANNGSDDMIARDVTGEDKGNVGNGKRALTRESDFWPDGIIPYSFDPSVSNDDHAKIRKAMDIWEKTTCIKFVHTPNSVTGQASILIRRKEGCQSSVGRKSKHRIQELWLGSGCMKQEKILHELGHTIGYHHEMNRYDRDNYITIDLSQEPRFESQFKLESRENTTDVGVPYDYRSIMHYKAKYLDHTFIHTKDPHFQDKIGTYTYLSFGDIKGINLAYKCAAHCTNTCTGDAFLDKDCQCMCFDSTQDDNRLATVPCVDMPSEQCVDKGTDCANLATYCLVYKEYMLDQCPRTCNLCVTTQARTTPPATTGACTDKLDGCPDWATYCDVPSSQHDMYALCPLTCNQCEPSHPCTDNTQQCASWTAMSYCMTYPDYMGQYCRRSCNLC